MFHGVGFDRPAQRLEEKQLREMMDGITSDQRRIAAVIASRTNIDPNVCVRATHLCKRRRS
jgi:hypothetical protein